ncbi:MAG: hypothetical protein HDT43_00830 [Ruminococcaceae bacterium]|nr:hypothetical protein [Oscillospiraceae bacterium]
MAKTIRHINEDSAEFVKTFNSLMTSRAAWEVWADFVSLAAISISNCVDEQNAAVRETEYQKIISKYKQDELEVFPKLIGMVVMALEKDRNQDFLGNLYMALELGNHWKGQKKEQRAVRANEPRELYR